MEPRLTSTSFIPQAFTSHSLWPTPRTSSSTKHPSDDIRRTSPSVTEPIPDMSWATGLGNILLKRYAPLIIILSGSLVAYGPLWDGGGEVLAVEWLAALL